QGQAGGAGPGLLRGHGPQGCAVAVHRQRQAAGLRCALRPIQELGRDSVRQRKKGQQPPAGIGTAISIKRRPGTSEGPRPDSGSGSFGSLPGPDWGPEPEPLPPPDQSAFDWMRQMLRTYGLDSLAGNIEDWI